MRFLGGKFRIAQSLTKFLKSVRRSEQVYCEPFVGGCSVIRFVDGRRIASDIDIDLIEFLNGLQEGWTPPTIMSEKRYKELRELSKNGNISPEIGFAKFFISFAGKSWAGYARDPKSNRDFVYEAWKDSIRLSVDINNVEFHCCDYEFLLKNVLPPERCLIYCDPPYKGTTGYKNKFDHNRFWEVIRKYSKIHDCYISEYQAPDDFECVWEVKRKTNLNMIDGGKSDRIERLFKYRGNYENKC